MKAKSEDVQYMRSDSQGNLYLYDAGAGMSGIPRRVIQMVSDEVIYGDNVQLSDEDVAKEMDSAERKFNRLASSLVHRLVPSNGDSIVKSDVRRMR